MQKPTGRVGELEKLKTEHHPARISDSAAGEEALETAAAYLQCHPGGASAGGDVQIVSLGRGAFF